MRYISPLVAAALLTSGAAASNGALTSRQVGVGLSSDICANLNFTLKVTVLGIQVTVGKIDVCLCKSAIPEFCLTNIVAVSASALVGQAKVEKIMNDQFSSSNCQTCQYPSHSAPQCLSDNPCSFTCKDGYTPSPPINPTTCSCKAPSKECNGKCGNYPSCPSQGVSKRDLDMLTARSRSCYRGMTACGILGRPGTWECVDTQSDLESCGGCVVPLWHGTPSRTGEDCSALPGVQGVSCVRGRCTIHRCEPGYVLGTDRTSCLRDESSDPDLLAEDYGLEHTTWAKKH